MDRVSKEELAAHDQLLEALWADAQQVQRRNWSDYDHRDTAQGKTKRSIELKRAVTPMIDQAEKLLRYEVYMGNNTTKELYEALEDLLVTTITRVTKLDISIGSRLRKQFLDEHSRSLQATVKLYWHEAWTRMSVWSDDGRH